MIIAIYTSADKKLVVEIDTDDFDDLYTGEALHDIFFEETVLEKIRDVARLEGKLPLEKE